VKVFEAKTLTDSVEARAKQYQELYENLELVKKKCLDIVNLGHNFEGKGATAIKEFYQAQIDVIDAWLRLVSKQIAFFNGIAGTTEDRNLAGSTVIDIPFLENELPLAANLAEELVSSHQAELLKIFSRIEDLVELDIFSNERFLEHMDRAESKRRDTITAVDNLDHELTSEYRSTEGDEHYVKTLFQQLQEASRQGNQISPIHFNTKTFNGSEVYQLKKQNEQNAKEYLSYKEEQTKFREQLNNKQEEREKLS
jgi:predicted ribonuclease toxin of YeeF-YezG toxin-antitoxin module